MTNSPVDYDKFLNKYGVVYDPIEHGTPPDFGGRVINVPGKGELPIKMNKKITHSIGDHATKFNTPADYVRAYDEVIKDSRFRGFLENSEPYLRLTDLRIDSIFGPNFQSRLSGYTKAVDSNGVVSIKKSLFSSDTVLMAFFKRDQNGSIKLVTMYPDF
jgi:hypothetical protein